MSVITGGKALDVSTPTQLFPTSTPAGSNVVRGLRQQYDVSADGKRFLFLNRVQTIAPPPITVFTNWQATLRR